MSSPKRHAFLSLLFILKLLIVCLFFFTDEGQSWWSWAWCCRSQNIWSCKDSLRMSRMLVILGGKAIKKNTKGGFRFEKGWGENMVPRTIGQMYVHVCMYHACMHTCMHFWMLYTNFSATVLRKKAKRLKLLALKALRYVNWSWSLLFYKYKLQIYSTLHNR